MAAAVVALAACGTARRAELEGQAAAVERTKDAALAKCGQSYPQPTSRPVLPAVQCYNAAWLAYVEGRQGLGLSPPGQLVSERAMAADLALLAERYDSGRLTAMEYEAERLRVIQVAMLASRQQANQDAMVAAAREQAAATSYQSAVAAQRSLSDSFRVRRSTTCNSWGNTTTCY